MNAAEIVFWLALALVVYTYGVYPLGLALAARCCRRSTRPKRPRPMSVSVVMTAYNEEAGITRRLQELTELLRQTGVPAEILVVSDGSTDQSVGRARSFASDGVRVLELAANVGKAAALSAACAEARNEIVVFADVRQRWDADALGVMLDDFRDPAVGAVTGDLVLENSTGLLAGVGLYWRYER